MSVASNCEGRTYTSLCVILSLTCLLRQRIHRARTRTAIEAHCPARSGCACLRGDGGEVLREALEGEALWRRALHRLLELSGVHRYTRHTLRLRARSDTRVHVSGSPFAPGLPPLAKVQFSEAAQFTIRRWSRGVTGADRSIFTARCMAHATDVKESSRLVRR
eukprot:2104474-Pleurochrysis_carterae.AAC.1